MKAKWAAAIKPEEHFGRDQNQKWNFGRDQNRKWNFGRDQNREKNFGRDQNRKWNFGRDQNLARKIGRDQNWGKKLVATKNFGHDQKLGEENEKGYGATFYAIFMSKLAPTALRAWCSFQLQGVILRRYYI